MRPQAPVNVVDGDGGAVILGRVEAAVDDTVADPTGRRVHARMRVAELVDVSKLGDYNGAGVSPANKRRAREFFEMTYDNWPVTNDISDMSLVTGQFSYVI